MVCPPFRCAAKERGFRGRGSSTNARKGGYAGGEWADQPRERELDEQCTRSEHEKWSDEDQADQRSGIAVFRSPSSLSFPALSPQTRRKQTGLQRSHSQKGRSCGLTYECLEREGLCETSIQPLSHQLLLLLVPLLAVLVAFIVQRADPETKAGRARHGPRRAIFSFQLTLTSAGSDFTGRRVDSPDSKSKNLALPTACLYRAVCLLAVAVALRAAALRPARARTLLRRWESDEGCSIRG